MSSTMTAFTRNFHRLFNYHFCCKFQLNLTCHKHYQQITSYRGSVISNISQIQIAKKISQDIDIIQNSISKDLDTVNVDLSECSRYQFEHTTGKFIRPKVICCIARAINNQVNTDQYRNKSNITEKQLKVAKIAEMIHTASLIHDDVIDNSEFRRSKPTVHSRWGYKKAVLTGDYILAVASKLLASLRHPDVIILLAQVIEDLVTGEFMQMKSYEENINFDNYLKRIYLKTASLFANSCKACSLLVSDNEHLSKLAFECGYNIGMAFQIVDDLLDITGDFQTMGKEAYVDLKCETWTLPIIFAIEEYPELIDVLQMKTKSPDKYEQIVNILKKTRAIDRTKSSAKSYIREACMKIDLISNHSDESELFKHYADIVLERTV